MRRMEISTVADYLYAVSGVGKECADWSRLVDHRRKVADPRR